jgi:hypothetical protein
MRQINLCYETIRRQISSNRVQLTSGRFHLTASSTAAIGISSSEASVAADSLRARIPSTGWPSANVRCVRSADGHDGPKFKK